MNCPQCQQVLRENALFCDRCGYNITASDAATLHVDHFDAPPKLKDPLVGRTLDSKYELIARLGEGGMGMVYRARRVHIGDEVAIKVLLQKYVKEKEALERFRREARAAARLRHTNIVTIHDFGEPRGDDAPAYIVMELLEGISLRDLLKEEGRLNAERSVALMRDICAGVGAAHRREIIHRDIKPDNIMVLPPDDEDDRETIKVVDFGIAKLRDLIAGQTLTQTGVAMGTPYYMSPEQCRGDTLDARSDVYSLGAMLYEMLAGAPPFVAQTATGVVAKHLTSPPPPLPEQVEAPTALEAAILRSLAKDPEDRQADAAVFGRELVAAMKPAATQPSAPKIAETPQPLPTVAAAIPKEPPPERTHPVQVETPASTVASKTPVQGTPLTEPVSPSPISAPSMLSRRSISAADLGLSETTPESKSGVNKTWLALGALILAAVIAGIIFMNMRGESSANNSQGGGNQSKSGGTTQTSSRQPGTAGAVAPSGKPLGTLQTQSKVYEVAIGPDGKTAASVGDESIVRLWRISESALPVDLKGHEQTARSVAISPDGNTVASGSDDKMIRLWQASDGRLLRTLSGHTDWVFKVAFSPDGQTIASAGGDKTVRLWRVGDGQLLKTLTTPDPTELIVNISPDLRVVALYNPENKRVRLWSINEDKLLATLDGQRYDVSGGAFTPDGKTLALGSKDGPIRLWRVSDGQLQSVLKGPSGTVGSVSFDADGGMLGAGYNDGTIWIWNVSNGEVLKTLKGHSKFALTVAFSGDNRILASGSEDKTIRLWEMSGGS